jgi:hypothetical protein
MTVHKNILHPVQKSGSGYKVINKNTGKPLDKHPIPKARAEAQLRAIEANKHGGFKGGK